jgi:hypothetical protein
VTPQDRAAATVVEVDARTAERHQRAHERYMAALHRTGASPEVLAAAERSAAPRPLRTPHRRQLHGYGLTCRACWLRRYKAVQRWLGIV